jgi:hypothetical protein
MARKTHQPSAVRLERVKAVCRPSFVARVKEALEYVQAVVCALEDRGGADTSRVKGVCAFGNVGSVNAAGTTG